MRALLLALATAALVTCHSSASSGSNDAGCDQLADEAVNALSPAEAQKSCTKDSDCILVFDDTACFRGCGAIVNLAGAAALDAAIAHVNATTCAAFRAASCGGGPGPCHPILGPSCVERQCTGLPPWDVDAGEDAESPVCAEETDAAQPLSRQPWPSQPSSVMPIRIAPG